MEDKVHSSPVSDPSRAQELMAKDQFAEALELLLNAEKATPGEVGRQVLEDISVCYMRLGDIACARGYLDRILVLEPSDSVARYNLAWCEQESGRTAEALRLYEALEREEGARVDLLYPMGRCALRLGDAGRALLLFRETLARGGGAELAYRMGAELIEAGHFGEARDILTAWLSRNSGDIDAIFALGIAYTRLGEHQKAIECFTRVAGRDGGKYETLLVSLAGCYWKVGKKERARSILRERIEEGPPLAEAYFTMGSFHEEDREDELALADYLEAGNIDHRFASAWEKAGDVATRLSRWEDARISYKKAYMITKNPAYAWKQGLVRLMEGDHAGALENFLVAGPENGGDDWFVHVALCRYRLGDHAAALEAAQEAYRRGKKDATVYFLAGSSLAKLGRNAEAERFLRDGTALFPHDVNLLYSMGLFQANQLDFEGAAERFRTALRFSRNPDIIYALALAYHKLGRKREAVVSFSEFTAAEGAEPNSVFRAALYLLELGAKREAMTALQRTVELDPSNRKAADFLRDLRSGEKA